jgi:hypothetical protein
MVGGSRVAFALKHLVLAVILLIVMFPVYWLVSMVSGQELVARADASYEPDVGARVWVRPDLRRAPCSTPGTKRASYDPLGEVSA